MGRLLPSRYTPEVNDRIINEAARILAAAAASGKPQRPTFAIAAVLFPVLVVGGLVAMEEGDAPAGGVAFDRASVIASEATGMGARARDFLGGRAPTRTTHPSVPPIQDPTRLPANRKASMRPAQLPTKALPPVGSRPREEASEPDEVLFDLDAGFAAVIPAAESASPVLLNVGTRIPIVLAEALTTGANAVPLSARVASDVVAGVRVAIPAGAPVIGDAFAVQENDRVQASLAVIVVGGKTLPLQGLVVGGDGELGLAGKVLKKGGKSRGAAGRALGWLGSAANAASLGVLAAKPGIGGAAALELTQDATRGLDRLAERWSLSDKVVRVPAGALASIHLRSDLELP